MLPSNCNIDISRGSIGGGRGGGGGGGGVDKEGIAPQLQHVLLAYADPITVCIYVFSYTNVILLCLYEVL